MNSQGHPVSLSQGGISLVPCFPEAKPRKREHSTTYHVFM